MPNTNKVLQLGRQISISEHIGNIIAGLTDSDGGFGFTWSPCSKMSRGFRLELNWTITQSKQNALLVDWVKQILTQGSVLNCGDNRIFKINTIQSFKDIVIPLFEQCQLYSPKLKSFLILKKVISIIDNKEHYTTKGLQKLLALHQELNGPQANKISSEVWAKRLNVPFNLKDAKREVQLVNKSYNNQVNLIRQKIKNGSLIVKPGYITGFTMGDGCFYISFGKPCFQTRSCLRIIPTFTWTQGNKSSLPLEVAKFYFQQFQSNKNTQNIFSVTGKGGKIAGRQIQRTTVQKFVLAGIQNAQKLVMEHFNLYPIPIGLKKQQCQIYGKVVQILGKSRQNQLSDVLDIVHLAYDMNAQRNPRQVIKADYIKMVEDYFKQKEIRTKKAYAKRKKTLKQTLKLKKKLDEGIV